MYGSFEVGLLKYWCTFCSDYFQTVKLYYFSILKYPDSFLLSSVIRRVKGGQSIDSVTVIDEVLFLVSFVILLKPLRLFFVSLLYTLFLFFKRSLSFATFFSWLAFFLLIVCEFSVGKELSNQEEMCSAVKSFANVIC